MMQRALLAVALVLLPATGVAQTVESPCGVCNTDRLASRGPGWPVPPITPVAFEGSHAGEGRQAFLVLRHESAGEFGGRAVSLDERAGTFARAYEDSGGPLDLLSLPLFAGDPDLDLIASRRSRLPGLPRLFGRVRGEYADDFDTQSRIGGSAHLRATPIFGFDIEWNYRREDLPRSRHDKLWTGDANVVYQLVNVRMINMRAGGGVAWLVDDGDGRAGYNITYGADFFVKRPWLMTLEFDFGRVGGDSITHARGTIGYVWGQIELYTGWDWYEVGHREFDGVIGGVTLWF